MVDTHTDTGLTAVIDMDPTAAHTKRCLQEIERIEKTHEHIHVITLAGGMCGGKTTYLDRLRKDVAVSGWSVIVQIENATTFSDVTGYRPDNDTALTQLCKHRTELGRIPLIGRSQYVLQSHLLRPIVASPLSARSRHPWAPNAPRGCRSAPPWLSFFLPHPRPNVATFQKHSSYFSHVFFSFFFRCPSWALKPNRLLECPPARASAFDSTDRYGRDATTRACDARPAREARGWHPPTCIVHGCCCCCSCCCSCWRCCCQN